jgi:hypothetical protein
MPLNVLAQCPYDLPVQGAIMLLGEPSQLLGNLCWDTNSGVGCWRLITHAHIMQPKRVQYKGWDFGLKPRQARLTAWAKAQRLAAGSSPILSDR